MVRPTSRLPLALLPAQRLHWFHHRRNKHQDNHSGRHHDRHCGDHDCHDDYWGDYNGGKWNVHSQH